MRTCLASPRRCTHNLRMATLTKLVGFLTTTKPEEARSFFEQTLGFRFIADDGFALVFDANGTTIRIAKAREFTPAHGTVLGWEVDDIRSAVGELVARGVHFEQFNLAFLKQDEMSVWTAPSGDEVAWFKDPDGNLLSISAHVSS